MLKTVDHLFHFTTNIDALKEIFKFCFKASYATESMAAKKIKVPMVSFSNCLLRDVGEQEILNYGKYAIALTREWGIHHKLNPVLYTYSNGMLEQSIQKAIESSTFLGYIRDFKEMFKELSEKKGGPFSKKVKLSNTSKESMAIIDYLSIKYDEELLESISAHSKAIHETNLMTIKLTKPYKVVNAKGEEFIAYNDREWRKIFNDLPILFEGDEEYKKWDSTKKPHFHKDPHLLHFDVMDIKAIMVEKTEQIKEVVDILKDKYEAKKVDHLLEKKELVIGVKEILEKQGF